MVSIQQLTSFPPQETVDSSHSVGLTFKNENSNKGEKGNNKRKDLVTTACDRCRKRKRKCDGNSPCGNCRKSGVGDGCTFEMPTSKRGPKLGSKHKKTGVLRKSRKKASNSEPVSPKSDSNSPGQSRRGDETLAYPSPFESAKSTISMDTSNEDSLVSVTALIRKSDISTRNNSISSVMPTESSALPSSTAALCEVLKYDTQSNVFGNSILPSTSSPLSTYSMSPFAALHQTPPTFNSNELRFPSFQLPINTFDAIDASLYHLLNSESHKAKFDTPLGQPIPIKNVTPAQKTKHNPILLSLLEYKSASSMVPVFSETEFYKRFNCEDGFSPDPTLRPFPQYVLDAITAFGCLLLKHPALYMSEYGGSPERAGELFACKVVEALEALPDSEKRCTDAVMTKLMMAVYYFYASNVDQGTYWMKRVYEDAEFYNWDVNADPTLGGRNNSLKDIKDRKIVYACFFLISTFGSRPLVGDEASHVYMCDPKTWESLGIDGGDAEGNWHGEQNANRIALAMQLCFLYRTVIRFASTPIKNDSKSASTNNLPTPTVTSLHDSLTGWFATVSSKYKAFNGLEDFLFGERELNRRTWTQQFCNLQTATTYILAMLKLHNYNHTNEIETGNVFRVGKFYLTSMDVILLCIRALVSALRIKMPDVSEYDFKDFQSYYQCLSFDSVISIACFETIELAVECLKNRKGWAGVPERRKEVANAYLRDGLMNILTIQCDNVVFLKPVYLMIAPVVESLVENINRE